MSDKIFLKDITLPIIETGEDETYSFVQTDSDLETAGDAADAKKVGDEITELKADLTSTEEALATKANIDGSYDSMTVGNAKQLTSNVGINDKAPYLFRTAGGANDIGDREEDTIIGGSIVWNQLMPNPADWVVQTANTPLVVDDIGGTLTATPNFTAYHPAIQGTRTLNMSVEGHKYLINIEFRTPDNDGDSNPTLYHSSTAFPTFGIAGSSKAGWNRGTVIKSATSTGGAIVGYLGLANAGEIFSDGDRLQFRNVQCFDLTAMFGSTIADYIYSLETATAGAGVAWFKKLFPKDYYPYSAPTFKHVEGLTAHKMVGFNQWDEDAEVGGINTANGQTQVDYQRIRSKNFISCLPGTTYYTNLGVNLFQYDENQNFISFVWQAQGTFTTASNCRYLKFCTATNYGTTYNHDICINLHWDGERDGEYEAYKEYTYPLDDSLTLRGIPKLDANNDLYYDGDTYEADGTVTRKYGIVDLGTLNWSYITTSDRNYFSASISDRTNANVISPVLTPKYVYGGDAIDSAMAEKDNGTIWTEKGYRSIKVKDSAYSDATTFKTAMDGVYLVYELATPTTETADPFQTPQIVDDWGTEEYVYTDGAFPIPVGHDTFYAANLKAKLEMAPDSPGDGDGDYVVRQTNGLNEYVKMVKELPSAPTTDGSYHLEVTVASGTPTLAWVADE